MRLRPACHRTVRQTSYPCSRARAAGIVFGSEWKDDFSHFLGEAVDGRRLARTLREWHLENLEEMGLVHWRALYLSRQRWTWMRFKRVSDFKNSSSLIMFVFCYKDPFHRNKSTERQLCSCDGQSLHSWRCLFYFFFIILGLKILRIDFNSVRKIFTIQEAGSSNF